MERKLYQGLLSLVVLAVLVAVMASPGATRAATIFTVTSADDTDDGVCDAHCTLREAITAANALAGADEIHFTILPLGPHTIAVNSSGLGDLPTITDPVKLFADTQPGDGGIELDGTLAGNGLTFVDGSDGSEVYGFVINRFPSSQISSDRADIFIQNNYIGTDTTGTIEMGGLRGILVDTAAVIVESNVISGHWWGVYLQQASATYIEGNMIGTDVTGTLALGNVVGVEVYESFSNTIGNDALPNVISGNGTGIRFDRDPFETASDDNVVRGNFIGTTADGASALGNTNAGIQIDSGRNGVISNVISGNGSGVNVTNFASAFIDDNYIGTDAAGSLSIGNASTGISIAGGGNSSTITNNVVSGNAGDGIRFEGLGSHNVWGNLIGSAGPPNIFTPLPNGGSGIVITGNSGSTIGLQDQLNAIVYNGGDGVRVEQGAFENRITHNFITGNGGLGINHIAGGNHELPSPHLTGSSPVTGVAPACPSCEVHVYEANGAQGYSFIGAGITDAFGSFSVTPFQSPFSSCIAVTVTDFDGNTSEFASIAVTPGGPNNDANFIDMSPLAYDDVTRARSDEASDPCDDDDDNDGLSDTHEASLPGPACPSATATTDNAKEDSDGDLVIDGAECLLGSDPADINSLPDISMFSDDDNDGVPQHLDADDSNMDSDGDGLHDGLEFRKIGTSTVQANTDSDGCGDSREVASINGDLAVSSIDLSQVAQQFALGEYAKPAPAYVVNFDVNRDGKVSSIDLGQVAQRFGPC